MAFSVFVKALFTSDSTYVDGITKAKKVQFSPAIEKLMDTLLLDRWSIDLSGAHEKEGHFHNKNFLRASK